MNNDHEAGWRPNTFRQNSLWIVVSWHRVGGTNSIPESLLSEKLSSFMAKVKDGDGWDMLLDAEDIRLDGIKYMARYSSSSEAEHVSVLETILKLYLSDRLACSDIYVVDARLDVIGKDYAPDFLPPVTTMGELLRGEKYHETVMECVNAESGIINVCKFTVYDPETSWERRFPVILCKRDEKMPGWKLHYIWEGVDGSGRSVTPSALLAQGVAYENKMCYVRYWHKHFLRNKEPIHPRVYQVTIATYKDDDSMADGERKALVGFINEKFASNERDAYKLKRASPHWNQLAFEDKIAENHVEHENWMDEQRSITHIEHEYWLDRYKTDIFVNGEKYTMMKWRADSKFCVYIYDNDLVEKDTAFNRKAYRYWVHMK